MIACQIAVNKMFHYGMHYFKACYSSIIVCMISQEISGILKFNSTLTNLSTELKRPLAAVGISDYSVVYTAPLALHHILEECVLNYTKCVNDYNVFNFQCLANCL